MRKKNVQKDTQKAKKERCESERFLQKKAKARIATRFDSISCAREFAGENTRVHQKRLSAPSWRDKEERINPRAPKSRKTFARTRV